MPALAQFADSSRTFPEIREVPFSTICNVAIRKRRRRADGACRTSSEPKTGAPATVLVMDGPGRLVRARRDRDRAGSGGKRATDPEAKLVAPHVGAVGVAACGAETPRIAVPGAAAEDTATAFAFFNPSRTVLRSPVVVLVLAILDPLPDIAMHVMETECIGGERADGSRPLIVPLAAAPVAIGVPFADLVAPRIGRLRSSTRRIFPFCLGEQPISLAGHPGEPGHIRLGVVPAHPNDRLSASSPATITGPVFVRAAADRDARVPIGERHLEL